MPSLLSSDISRRMPGDIDLPPLVRGEYPMLELVFYFTFGSSYRMLSFSIIMIEVGSKSKSIFGSLAPLLFESKLKDLS
jgi:hypothetical protein